MKKTYRAFSAGELSPDMYGRYDVDKYGTGCMLMKNWVIMAEGGVYKRPGMMFVASAGDETKKVRLIPFQFSTVQPYILEFGDQYMRVYRDGSLVLESDQNIVSITMANPCNIEITGHGYTTGDEVFLDSIGGMVELNNRQAKITVVDADNFTLDGIDSTAYTTFTSGGTAAKVYEISTPFLEAELFDLYFTQTADVMSLCHRNHAPRELTRTGHTSWTLSTISFTANPFTGAGDYPGVVGFSKQRRVFASTDNKPDTIWMSRAGAYADMTVNSPGQDDDAIIFAPASGEVNAISHILGFKDLLTMTDAQEWRVYAQSGSLTPTTVTADPETNYGSSNVPPIKIGNRAIFPARFGTRVRDYAYTFESDGYDGGDISILSKHLLENKEIVDWAYAQEPDNIVWAAMSDGSLVSLTYLREHRVFGWARHETNGFVESVAAIPDKTARRDVPYYVVRRTVDGQTRRYIEKLEKYVDDPMDEAFFVDSGLVYDGAATDTVRGLWHLEGETVKVYADGNVLADATVTNGAVTLTSSYSRITVGLGTDYEIQPLATEFDEGKFGATKGDPKQIKTIDIEVYKTRGLFFGQGPEAKDNDLLNELTPQFAGEDLSADIEGYSEILEMAVDPTWNDDYVAPYIYDNYPVPAKILTMTPNYGTN